VFDLFSRAILSTSGDSLVIYSAPARYVGWIIAFAVLLPAGWIGWRRRIGGTLAPGVFFASFAIPLIVVPGIALERIEVSPRGLSSVTGFWFKPTRREVRFDGLLRIDESAEAVKQRRLPREDLVWTFYFANGRNTRLKLSDLLSANRGPVLDHLRRQGVEVRMATPR
jgi:hypothetical protein